MFAGWQVVFNPLRPEVILLRHEDGALILGPSEQRPLVAPDGFHKFLVLKQGPDLDASLREGLTGVVPYPDHAEYVLVPHDLYIVMKLAAEPVNGP